MLSLVEEEELTPMLEAEGTNEKADTWAHATARAVNWNFILYSILI